MTVIYVGDYDYSPVNEFAPGAFVNPRDFKQHSLPRFSNNPYFVDCYSADNVIVCSKKGNKKLSEHPEYNKWKDEFKSGEFWNMVGEDWI